MKILQEQYNLIKEGKGNKQHFMKLAHYNFPELVTPVLSYNDTITVLKNKSILSEGIGGLVTTPPIPSDIIERFFNTLRVSSYVNIGVINSGKW